MARTNVPITTLTTNAATADPAGTAIDATNSHVINTAGVPTSRLAIRVLNTTASTKVATVKAGDNPPAGSSGQGDLAVSLTDGSTTATVKWVTLEAARFMQNDGTINIDIGSGMTGFISVFEIPR